MILIVFSLLYFGNSSTIKKEIKIDENGRKYHYSERYEEEFIYEDE